MTQRNGFPSQWAKVTISVTPLTRDKKQYYCWFPPCFNLASVKVRLANVVGRDEEGAWLDNVNVWGTWKVYHLFGMSIESRPVSIHQPHEGVQVRRTSGHVYPPNNLFPVHASHNGAISVFWITQMLVQLIHTAKISRPYWALRIQHVERAGCWKVSISLPYCLGVRLWRPDRARSSALK